MNVRNELLASVRSLCEIELGRLIIIPISEYQSYEYAKLPDVPGVSEYGVSLDHICLARDGELLSHIGDLLMPKEFSPDLVAAAEITVDRMRVDINTFAPEYLFENLFVKDIAAKLAAAETHNHAMCLCTPLRPLYSDIS